MGPSLEALPARCAADLCCNKLMDPPLGISSAHVPPAQAAGIGAGEADTAESTRQEATNLPASIAMG